MKHTHTQRFTSPAEFPYYRTQYYTFISFQLMEHACVNVCVSISVSFCVCVCVRACGLLGLRGDNKWQQTWTSISVITRRAEQRQWQTSAWGPSIYETGHASNRKTPHTVMARGKANRQLITALNFDASSRAGEKIYIIPLFLHRWWDTGWCVCLVWGDVVPLWTKKKCVHIHTHKRIYCFCWLGKCTSLFIELL